MTLPGFWQLYGWDLKLIDGFLSWLAWKVRIQAGDALFLGRKSRQGLLWLFQGGEAITER